jgi:hypothetical protein
VTVAFVGMVRIAVDRAVAGVIEVSAVAVLESERQNTSGDVSLVCEPQLLATDPTVGAGVWDPQSCASVLPITRMSPTWFAW